MNPAKFPLLAGLCLALVLTACGGGQDSSATSDTDKADAVTSTPDTLASASTSPTLSEEEKTAWERSAALSRAEVQQSTAPAAQAQSAAVSPQAISAPAAPIYRFFNNQTGSHLFTKSITERDTVLNTLAQLRYEGPVFSAWQSTDTGLYPVYRFANTRNGAHVYSISEAEKNNIVANMPWIQLEGPAYYASKTAQAGTTPLYRFLHLQKGFHFYTASASEKDYIDANLKSTYKLEGVAYYVSANIGTFDRALASFVGKANTLGYVNGLGESARFEQLWGMASAPDGNLYAVDADDYYGNARPEVRRVSPSGVVTSFVGSRTESDGYVDGVGSGARFYGLYAITFDAAGTGYVGDYKTIRSITPAGAVTTLAGSKTEARSYVNGQAQSARFYNIKGIARDTTGNIFVVDDHVIRKLSTSGVVSTFAGAAPTETYKHGFADGTGTAARFNDPGQMAIDASNNLYVADEGNHRIRKITPAGLVTTLAGQSSYGVVDGNGSAAKFDNPFAIAVDKATGNVYTADWDGYTVRKITPSGDVSTVVGVAYTPGVFFGALPAGLSRVGGLAVQGNRLYIASNHGIYWTHLP